MSSSLGFSEISDGENVKDIYKPKNNLPIYKVKISELASTIIKFNNNLDHNFDEKNLNQFETKLLKTFKSYQ